MGNRNTRPFREDYAVGRRMDLEGIARYMNAVSKMLNGMKGLGGVSVSVVGGRIHISGGSGSPSSFPWDVLPGDPGEVSIRPGTGTATPASGPESVVPTIGGDPLTDDPPPVLTFATGGSEDGLHEVFLGCEINVDGLIVLDSWTITHKKPGDTAPPPVAYDPGPAELLGEAYLLLSSFEVTGDVVSNQQNFIKTSVNLNICDATERKWVWSGFGAAN